MSVQKSNKIIFCCFISVLIFISAFFLTSCGEINNQNPHKLTVQDTYAYGAITLSQLFLKDTTPASIKENTMLSSSINDFNESDISKITSYLPTIVGTLLNNGKLKHETFPVLETSPYYKTYKTRMTISYKDLHSQTYNYEMYYNDNALTDTKSENINLTESELNGIIIYNSQQSLQIVGKKIFNKSNTKLLDIELKVMIKENSNRYAIMKQTTESSLQKHTISLCEINNNEVSVLQNSVAKIFNVNNELMFKLTIIDKLENSNEYEFTIKNNTENSFIQLNYLKTIYNAIKSGTVNIANKPAVNNTPIYEFYDLNNNPINI